MIVKTNDKGRYPNGTTLLKKRKLYLKNAYRVLLTRARQGMVIVVPEGDADDATRKPEYYDETYEHLRSIGIGKL